MFKKITYFALTLVGATIISSAALAAAPVPKTKTPAKKATPVLRLLAISNLKAQQSTSTVILVWGKPGKGNKYAGYTVFRSEKARQLGIDIGHVAKDKQTFTDKTVAEKHTYYYSVRYYAKGAISANGKQVKITIKPFSVSVMPKMPSSTATGTPVRAATTTPPVPITTPQTSTSTGVSPRTISVNIINFAFQASSVTVHVGDTVIWTNHDEAPHTVTADDGSFDSQTIAPAGTYSHTFTQKGSVLYHCTIHPSMSHGTIVVE